MHLCCYLYDFRYAKRQRTHEIISGRTIPVPYLDQNSTVTIFCFQIAVEDGNLELINIDSIVVSMDGVGENDNLQCNRFIPNWIQ